MQYTSAQKKYIVDNVKGITSYKLAELFNKEFGTNVTRNQIRVYMRNHKLTNGINTSFAKGHVPINKGTKGMFNVGGNKTSFKKGQQSFNTVALGTEVVKTDGYVYIKTSSKGRDHRDMWTRKSKIVWENINGLIPEGCYLLHLDGNKTNDDISNLCVVTKSEMLIINKQKLVYSDKELTSIGLNIAKIVDKTNKSIKTLKVQKKS